MDDYYAIWLVQKIRRIRFLNERIKSIDPDTDRINTFNSLVTTYINNQYDNYDFHPQEKQIYTLIQFLSFISNFTGQKESLGDINYYRIEFPMRDFLDFIGLKGHYQRQRILQFLRMNTPIIEFFEDDSFRSYLPFPQIELDNSKKISVLRVWVQEALYFCRYSFLFPTEFIQEHGKTDLKLKLQFIRILTNSSIKKEFHVQEFLNQFHFSNEKKKQLRQDIIHLITILVQTNFIDSHFQLIPIPTKQTQKHSQNKQIVKLIKLKHLTPFLLLKTQTIYFQEIINKP